MNLNQKGVSPVVGTILLIGIAVIMAGTIGYFAISQSTPEPAPVAHLSEEVEGNAICLYNDGGDTIGDAPSTLSVKLNGNTISSDNITVTGGDNDLEAGERMEISADFSKGDELAVAHKPSNSILLKSTIEKNPPKPSPTKSWIVSSQTEWENYESKENVSIKDRILELDRKTIDNFEDGDIAEYSGDTGSFATTDSFVHDGSYGLEATDDTGENQIYRDGFSISQGTTMTFWQYVVSNSQDEPTFEWGTGSDTNYAVSLDPLNDVVSIAKDATTNDGSGTILKQQDVAFDNQWYKVRIDWKNNDNIAVTVYENDGSTVIRKISVVDSTYESADTIGFGYRYQHGGWDAAKGGFFPSGTWTSTIWDSGASNQNFEKLSYSASIGTSENVLWNVNSYDSTGTLLENSGWVLDEDGTLTSAELSTNPTGRQFSVGIKLETSDMTSSPSVENYTLQVN